MKTNKINIWLIIVVIESLILIIGSIYLVINSDGIMKQPSTLVIDVIGNVVGPNYPYPQSEGGSRVVSAIKIIEVLKKYEKEDDIKAFILNIDSNGGDSTGSILLEKQLQIINKPVVAVVRDQALSSGYSVAAATKRIFANELSNIADIGVIKIVEYEGKQGRRTCFISNSNIKLMYNEDCPGLDPTRYSIEKDKVVKASEQMAVEIAQLRGLQASYVMQFADGIIFKGKEALKLKLVDEIGGLQEAKEWLEEEIGLELNLIYLREIEKIS